MISMVQNQWHVSHYSLKSSNISTRKSELTIILRIVGLQYCVLRCKIWRTMSTDQIKQKYLWDKTTATPTGITEKVVQCCMQSCPKMITKLWLFYGVDRSQCTCTYINKLLIYSTILHIIALKASSLRKAHVSNRTLTQECCTWI